VVDAFVAGRTALLATGRRRAQGLQGIARIPRGRHSDRGIRHLHARKFRRRLGTASNHARCREASGLAAGKGVVIVDSADEAFVGHFGGQFGSAGDLVVIEEFHPARKPVSS
jgi:hypothetical protein